MTLPFDPPVAPMLAKAARSVPEGDFVYEPKWDGFRCLVFRDGDDLHLQSRNAKPLLRYFPELRDPFLSTLPDACVLDGELVIDTPGGLDFDALNARQHPAESRVRRLAVETPATFIAFDLIALGGEDLRATPFAARREALGQSVPGTPYMDLALPAHDAAPAADPPALVITPATRDIKVARDWFEHFEGAGLDGVVAKPAGEPYRPGERALVKVKHERTIDCVVAGYRPHTDGSGVGSLLLGLYDGSGALHFVGAASSFTKSQRVALLDDLAPLVLGDADPHPWRAGSADPSVPGARTPGGEHRWASGRDTSFVALRPERVVEVGFNQMTAGRFRHPARLLRPRPDRDPTSCHLAQLTPKGRGVV